MQLQINITYAWCKQDFKLANKYASTIAIDMQNCYLSTQLRQSMNAIVTRNNSQHAHIYIVLIKIQMQNNSNSISIYLRYFSTV